MTRGKGNKGTERWRTRREGKTVWQSFPALSLFIKCFGWTRGERMHRGAHRSHRAPSYRHSLRLTRVSTRPRSTANMCVLRFILKRSFLSTLGQKYLLPLFSSDVLSRRRLGSETEWRPGYFRNLHWLNIKSCMSAQFIWSEEKVWPPDHLRGAWKQRLYRSCAGMTELWLPFVLLCVLQLCVCRPPSERKYVSRFTLRRAAHWHWDFFFLKALIALKSPVV